jgi:hypothetical protein
LRESKEVIDIMPSKANRRTPDEYLGTFAQYHVNKPNTIELSRKNSLLSAKLRRPPSISANIFDFRVPDGSSPQNSYP